MTILLMTDDLSQLGGITAVTTPGTFDPDYATESLLANEDISYAVDFPAGTTDEVWFHFDLFYTLIGSPNGGYFTMTDVNGATLGLIDLSGSRMRVQTTGIGAGFLFGDNLLRTMKVQCTTASL